MKLWKTRLPNKIKVFMWMAIQNRLQTGVKLKEWKGIKNCYLYGVLVWRIFNCRITKVIWFCFKEALGWDITPSSMQDVLDNPGFLWRVMTITLNSLCLQ